MSIEEARRVSKGVPRVDSDLATVRQHESVLSHDCQWFAFAQHFLADAAGYLQKR